VLRFWNREVTENPEGVAEAIIRKAAECIDQ
jgi:very-short-patch-repair endonuclease